MYIVYVYFCGRPTAETPSKNTCIYIQKHIYNMYVLYIYIFLYIYIYIYI